MVRGGGGGRPRRSQAWPGTQARGFGRRRLCALLGRPAGNTGSGAAAPICYARAAMSYVVLARKWRPQSFEDLVGQEHVSTTLENAIATCRVAHAFLFTGVRGVGKTTSARILAKALDCEKGPTAKPCQVCAPCEEITAGRDLDVQEIDGARYTRSEERRGGTEGRR